MTTNEPSSACLAPEKIFCGYSPLALIDRRKVVVGVADGFIPPGSFIRIKK
ncbi:3533_t:CDS:2, partial [Acaulospora morrowiae]